MPKNIGFNGLKYTDQYQFPEYKKDMPYLVDEFGGIKWNPSQQMESAQNTSWGYGIYYLDRTPKFDMKRIHDIFSQTPKVE